MNVGILGGYGFLGYTLAEVMREGGCHVCLGDIKRPILDDFEFYKVDITKYNQISKFISDLDLDVVILTAAITNVDFCEDNEELAMEINGRGPGKVAKACQDNNAKMVLISTDFVFDGMKGNYSESDRTNPISVYGKTKLEGEVQVQKYIPDNHLICRTSVLYGINKPFQHTNFVLWVKEQLEGGKKISVTRSQNNNPTLVDDLAEMIYELVKQNKKGTWHTVGSECLNRYEFAIKIAQFFNLDEMNIQKIDKFTQKAKRPALACLSIEKIRKELKYNPADVNHGLKRIAFTFPKST
ncbi:MAG: SDR family oxidoreductase [Promethearchaeota archaeon]